MGAADSEAADLATAKAKRASAAAQAKRAIAGPLKGVTQ